MPEQFSSKAGFGVSQPFNYVIPVGQATAVEAVLDLGRPYGFLLIGCPNTVGAASQTDTMSIRLGYDTDGPMMELNGDDNAALAPQVGTPATFWRKYFVGAARRVQIVISAPVVAELPFVLIGVDAALVAE